MKARPNLNIKREEFFGSYSEYSDEQDNENNNENENANVK